MLLTNISLKGLKIAPSQVWGSIRIVPLIRPVFKNDLRLFCRSYDEDLSIVSVDKNLAYASYIPHGLILSWSDDGSPVAAYGGQIIKTQDKQIHCNSANLRLMQRMVKRESKNQLRFLPLHLAMEGFLSMFFSGPNIAWSEYSRYAIRNGLGCRYETSVSGRYIAGLEEALRVFEIHPGQVGVLVFVAEALASAFIVPTPADYRLLHTSLIEDFYGELLYQYGLLYKTTFPMNVSIDESKINDLESLRQAVGKMRSDWAAFQGFMADGILERNVQSQKIYTAGKFVLQRFITELQGKTDNHIGEAIVRDTGELEYLKTYRLSSSQVKRVHILSQLAKYNWNIDATATASGKSREEFIQKLEKAGFGYLIRQDVREVALKKLRQK